MVTTATAKDSVLVLTSEVVVDSTLADKIDSNPIEVKNICKDLHIDLKSVSNQTTRVTVSFDHPIDIIKEAKLLNEKHNDFLDATNKLPTKQEVHDALNPEKAETEGCVKDEVNDFVEAMSKKGRRIFVIAKDDSGTAIAGNIAPKQAIFATMIVTASIDHSDED